MTVNTDNKGTNKSINKKSRRTYGGDSHLSALQKKRANANRANIINATPARKLINKERAQATRNKNKRDLEQLKLDRERMFELERKALEVDSASVCAKNHVISNVIGSEVDNASVGFEVVNTKSINKKCRRTYGGDSHLSTLQKKQQIQIERIKLMQLLQGN